MNSTIRYMLVVTMLSVGTMLSAGAMNSFAASHQQGQQTASAAKTVTGQIARIKNNNLTLKDQAGKYRMVTISDPSMLQGLKSGDEVTVAYQDGKATSIKKVEGYAPSAGSNKNM